MIKILLVDDDFLVRTFLSRLTNWTAHGYSLVGAAQDGEQALEMAGEYQPDIIITDISMPVMDGITLIRRLKKEKNPAKIVVLSCHDDFEYVREAMKLGADEYVLKNLLTEESMLKLLSELEKTIVQPLPGQYDPEKERADIVQQLKGTAQPQEQSTFRIRAALAIRIKDYDKRVAILPMEQQERFQASFLQVCQDSARQDHCIRSAHVRRELYAVVFDFRKGESRAERQEALAQVAATLAHNTDQYLAAEVRIGISDAPDFGMEPAVCWESALDALEATFYEPQAICYAWQCCPSHRVIPEEARAFCDNIAAYMERRDGNAIRAGYTQALEAFASQHTQSHLVREWMMQAQRKAGLSVQEAPQHFSELEGQEQAFLAFCEELLPDLSQYSEPVAQAIRFVQKNYQDNISLNDASDAVHLNAAYLSFIFHKETDITFSEYLTSCRINRAKELLLQTGDKVKEIGRQAGYRDNRHFCKMFKRVTGMTPQEYRKINA